MTTPGDFEVHQEDDVIPSRRLALITALSLVTGIVGVFFAWLVLETNTGGIRSTLPGGAGPAPASSTISGLEQSPIFGAGRGNDLKAAERVELSQYRWLDRDAGVAAIPIERAMDLVIQGSP